MMRWAATAPSDDKQQVEIGLPYGPDIGDVCWEMILFLMGDDIAHFVKFIHARRDIVKCPITTVRQKVRGS